MGNLGWSVCSFSGADSAPAQRRFRDHQDGETWLPGAPVQGLESEPGAVSQARTRGCRRAGTLGIPEGSSWDSQAVVAAEMLEGDLGVGKGQGRVRHEPSWCQYRRETGVEIWQYSCITSLHLPNTFQQILMTFKTKPKFRAPCTGPFCVLQAHCQPHDSRCSSDTVPLYLSHMTVRLCGPCCPWASG